MKVIAITPKGYAWRAEVTSPLHHSARRLIGGGMEIVRPIHLPRPYCMICNDNFLALGLPINPVGCRLYGTAQHGNPICGMILIVKEITRGGETTLAGLDDEELEELEAWLHRMVQGGDRP